MEQYWIQHAGNVTGPFTKAQLTQFASSGMLKPDDLVSPDQQRWTPAGRIPGLFSQDAGPQAGPGEAIGVDMQREGPKGLAMALAFGGAGLALALALVTVIAGASGSAATALTDRTEPLKVVDVAEDTSGNLFESEDYKAAMEYVPGNASFVGHVNVKKSYKILERLIKSSEEPQQDKKKTLATLKKVDMLHFYLEQGEKTVYPMIVVRSSLSPEEILEAARETGENETVEIEETGNGEYRVRNEKQGERSTNWLFIGDQHPDLPDGVTIWASPQTVEPKDIQRFGSRQPDEVISLLGNVPADAPIWFGANIEDMRFEGDMHEQAKMLPEAAWGAFYPEGEKDSSVVLAFEEDDDADDLQNALKESKENMPFKWTRTGDRFTLSATIGGELSQQLQGMMMTRIGPLLGGEK
ncbi:MAG: DUF4339 domain-containing protein [Phycisphaerae bacterium]